MTEHEARVKRLTEIREASENDRYEFGKKHGFVYKRAQDYKKCVVIRWKTSGKKYEINYPKIQEYTDFAYLLADKYSLWNQEDPLLSLDLILTKAGIYCSYQWDYKIWAIPDECKEVQDYVLSNLPKWAKVTRKP